MSTINSLRQGSIAETGQKDQYKLSKNCFISVLCSTHPDFPINLWDKLLPQATLSLNFLLLSLINPQLSARVQIHRSFNFDETPLAPPRIKVLTYKRSEGREYFSVHSAQGCYSVPCLNQYRCYNVWIRTTNSTLVTNTVDCLPHKIPMHIASATDVLLSTENYLTASLCQSQ